MFFPIERTFENESVYSLNLRRAIQRNTSELPTESVDSEQGSEENSSHSGCSTDRQTASGMWPSLYLSPCTPFVPLTNTNLVLSQTLELNTLMKKPSSQQLSTSTPKPSTLNAARFKTRLCRNWLQNGQCSFAEGCAYAHGLQELRPASQPSVDVTTVLDRLAKKMVNKEKGKSRNRKKKAPKSSDPASALPKEPEFLVYKRSDSDGEVPHIEDFPVPLLPPGINLTQLWDWN